ncbi:hypothetical protein KKF84_19450 [Myxococcota bacterium]|nr:hypothetical protein [Myxococcota bacterium]MBU1537500.1 hypothetical protein [Myxococcota bacterium]
MKSFPAPVIFLMSLLALWGCTPMKSKQELQNLEPSVIQYYEQLKWYRATLAKDYVVPAQRPKFLDDVDEASQKMKISYINVIRITPFEKNKKAAVRLRVVWHVVDEGIVHETVVEDTWKRFKNTWLKVSSKIIKGKKLPYIFKP